MMRAARTPMSELYERITTHPELYGRISIESAASLPVLVAGVSGPELAVFWYPAGGPIDDRRAYPPYFGATVPLDRPTQIHLGALDAAALGIHPGADGSLGPSRLGGVESFEESDALYAALFGSLDQLAPAFPQPPAALGDSERAAARQYLRAFAKLADIGVRDVYRARSPEFFAWLEALAG